MIKSIFIATTLFAIVSCTSSSTALHTNDKINRENLKKGVACSRNLFGGFTLPYFKETTIKVSGSQSIMAAINKGKINKPVIIDEFKKHWVVYSELCTIVYGE